MFQSMSRPIIDRTEPEKAIPLGRAVGVKGVARLRARKAYWKKRVEEDPEMATACGTAQDTLDEVSQGVLVGC